AILQLLPADDRQNYRCYVWDGSDSGSSKRGGQAQEESAHRLVLGFVHVELVRQIDAVTRAQLAHDLVNVRLNRAVRYGEAVPDLFVRLAAQQQYDDLTFARGQDC